MPERLPDDGFVDFDSLLALFGDRAGEVADMKQPNGTPLFRALIHEMARRKRVGVGAGKSDFRSDSLFDPRTHQLGGEPFIDPEFRRLQKTRA